MGQNRAFVIEVFLRHVVIVIGNGEYSILTGNRCRKEEGSGTGWPYRMEGRDSEESLRFLGSTESLEPREPEGKRFMSYTLPSHIMGLQYLLRNECGMFTKVLATN